MSLSFAELARMNAMDERIKALEADAKRRKGGRPKKVVHDESGLKIEMDALKMKGLAL